jgi:integrase
LSIARPDKSTPTGQASGMRKEEVLALRWEQVDLEASTIALAPEDTKTDEPRLIVLTSRAKEALRTLPSRFKKKGYVFVNPKTKTRRVEAPGAEARRQRAGAYPSNRYPRTANASHRRPGRRRFSSFGSVRRAR